MLNKIKLIFLPFLLITIGFISAYSFFNWLLFIHLNWFPVKESLRNFIIPMCFLAVIIFIWLKPRIDLLEFKNKRNATVYVVAAWFLILIPIVVAQKYLEIATGKLTELDSISDITTQEKTKFYTVQNYFVFKNGAKFTIVTNVSGSRDQDLTCNIYAACPIYESKNFRNRPVAAWLGVKYTLTMSNRLSIEEKEMRSNKFIDKTEKDFLAKDLQNFIYLDRISYSDDLEAYQEAIKNDPRLNSNNNIILIPVNEPYASRTGNKAFWLCVSFLLGAFVWMLLLCKPKLKNVHKVKKHVFSEAYEKFFTFFVPKKDYVVTPILMNLNILIFVARFLSPNNNLLEWGANYGPAIIKGEYWRLLTNIFLHSGFIHLICNITGLLFVGISLEPILGRIKFILSYLSIGIMASLTSAYWYGDTLSVGASGAIIGLYGMLLAFLMPKNLPAEIRNPLLCIATIFVVSSLLMGFTKHNLDNAAHFSGLAFGFLLGLLLDRDKKTALALLETVKIDPFFNTVEE